MMLVVYMYTVCTRFFLHNTCSEIILGEGVQDVEKSSLFNEPYQMYTNNTYKSGKREVSCY